MERLPRLPIRVERVSKVPAYRQIVEQVRALIAAGVLAPGDQLPTIRRVADEARINFNTVARAYRILDASGLISTQHGRGTYAVARLPSVQARRARRAALGLMVQDLVAAAVRIGCAPQDVLAAVERETGRSQGKAR